VTKLVKRCNSGQLAGEMAPYHGINSQRKLHSTIFYFHP
jgi:hypothetical protein